MIGLALGIEDHLFADMQSKRGAKGAKRERERERGEEIAYHSVVFVLAPRAWYTHTHT